MQNIPLGQCEGGCIFHSHPSQADKGENLTTEKERDLLVGRPRRSGVPYKLLALICVIRGKFLLNGGGKLLHGL